jgi:dCMP deaminase
LDLENKMKQKWIDAFMDTAERFAQLSSAVRLQVGAVVVKDNRIISIGYNGTPAGWDNRCEDIVQLSDDTLVTKTKPEVIHAEANAIGKLARDGEAGAGASMFCTHAPCVDCAKMIYGAGIQKVYYRDSYRNDDGLTFLQACNIEVQKVLDINS